MAIYGRRRDGKTFLIRNAIPEFDFFLTGVANVNTATQLANFHLALKKYDVNDRSVAPPKNWLEAFAEKK